MFGLLSTTGADPDQFPFSLSSSPLLCEGGILPRLLSSLFRATNFAIFCSLLALETIQKVCQPLRLLLLFVRRSLVTCSYGMLEIWLLNGRDLAQALSANRERGETARRACVRDSRQRPARCARVCHRDRIMNGSRGQQEFHLFKSSNSVKMQYFLKMSERRHVFLVPRREKTCLRFWESSKHGKMFITFVQVQTFGSFNYGASHELTSAFRTHPRPILSNPLLKLVQNADFCALVRRALGAAR